MSGLQHVAVVVGVGPGTGAAVARRFAREGFKTALLSRKLENLTPIEHEIQQAGGKAISVPCDCGKPDEIAAAITKIRLELGDPSVLIYNAGPSGITWPPPGILDTDHAAWQKSLDTGVSGGLYFAQQVLPKMVEAGQGTIIFTGATAALRGGKNFAMLAVPKFALRGLSQCIAREFQPQGIHCCHVIVDGIIDTPRIKKMRPSMSADEKLSADSIADVYWGLHTQHRSTWTQELDIRPFTEKW
ncbi:hypothetical protein WJX84_010916 [Apatococcus fuscideae]|uniref:Uncharacterized protein n=1 Tax=Apatococcus fuscideae TaxID=2026836 RepID=A0AAW1SSF5_9CHLO